MVPRRSVGGRGYREAERNGIFAEHNRWLLLAANRRRWTHSREVPASQTRGTRSRTHALTRAVWPYPPVERMFERLLRHNMRRASKFPGLENQGNSRMPANFIAIEAARTRS